MCQIGSPPDVLCIQRKKIKSSSMHFYNATLILCYNFSVDVPINCKVVDPITCASYLVNVYSGSGSYG